jgi:CheY-like chemotaxis protein
MIRSRIILLAEDNPNGVKLTIHAFERGNICNEIVVVGDGEEAIDYLATVQFANSLCPT